MGQTGGRRIRQVCWDAAHGRLHAFLAAALLGADVHEDRVVAKEEQSLLKWTLRTNSGERKAENVERRGRGTWKRVLTSRRQSSNIGTLELRQLNN